VGSGDEERINQLFLVLFLLVQRKLEASVISELLPLDIRRETRRGMTVAEGTVDTN